jgi:hypothetical protein
MIGNRFHKCIGGENHEKKRKIIIVSSGGYRGYFFEFRRLWQFWQRQQK